MQRKIMAFRKASSIIIEGGRQWIFPQMCPMCGRLRTEPASMGGSQGMLCPLCESKGFDLAGPLDRVLPDGLQGVHSGFPFVRDGPLQEMLHALKYQIRPDVGEQLGRMLAIHRLASWLEASNVNPTDVDPNDCLLIPVPIHWKRRLGRGYNQSETIAQGIQAVFPTQTQTRYSEEKRARNIRGAIAVSQHADMVERLNTLAAHRPVWILVDDVFTSGATLFECSSVLHEWVGRSESLAKGHDIALHAWVVANAEDGM
jgi:predicted amidophosphoribosyltransferase